MTNTKSVEMGLLQIALDKVNGLLNGVVVIPFVHAQWSLASLPDCECGAIEQNADHVLTVSPTVCIGHDMEYMI